MELIIHAGLDKCGSTAIQVHLQKHRRWFLQQDVYIPRSGLTGLGHHRLFADMSASGWVPLQDELKRAGSFKRGLISFEGLHFLPAEQLLFMQEQLRDHDLKFLFYLREQSRIIQSGYLQILKQRRQANSMANFGYDAALLTPPSRDYRSMLEQFERVFPEAGIGVRAYDLSQLKGGSIVPDFLQFLDLDSNPPFLPATRRHNISLDVQAGQLLNVYDSVSDDVEGREALVEDLLLLIARDGGGSRCFLDDEAIRFIAAHYAASNAWLKARYGVDLTADVSPVVPVPARDSAKPPVCYVSRLAALARFPRWNGDGLAGQSLATLLQHAPGWSCPSDKGAWSSGTISRINFRLPKARGVESAEVARVSFKGRYFAANDATELWVNGTLLGIIDLRDCEVALPPESLDGDRVIQLELRHAAPVSPASLGESTDQRLLAYCLEAIACFPPEYASDR